jgi:glycine/D-amino acid oxidase-like deaminating enzyme
VFTSDPLWKPYFHQTGLYWMCGRDYARDCIQNFEKLGRHGDISVWPIEEARKMFGGLFDESDYTNVEQVLVNKASGWVAAGDCLQAVTRHIIQQGVNYVAEEVSTLLFDRKGQCTGLQTTNGRKLEATQVVLCTGAFTPKLLEMSAAASGLNNLQAGSRILAGGITTGMTRLDDESYTKFADMPVGIQGYTTLKGRSPVDSGPDVFLICTEANSYSQHPSWGACRQQKIES